MSRRVALVSGGSKGLGLAIVRDCLEHGWNVYTFSRSKTGVVEALLEKYPDTFEYMAVDQGEEGAPARIVRAAHERFGALHALVNNAALAHDGVLAVMRPGDIAQLVEVNVTSMLLLTRECVRGFLRLPRTESKTVINISSVVSITGYRGLAAYGSTKAAMLGLTRSLARELGPANVTVNAVLPGFLETDMTHTLGDQQRDSIIRRTPLGRLGRAEDVTPTVRFLLGDGARFITGQSFVVDGGSTC